MLKVENLVLEPGIPLTPETEKLSANLMARCEAHNPRVDQIEKQTAALLAIDDTAWTGKQSAEAARLKEQKLDLHREAAAIRQAADGYYLRLHEVDRPLAADMAFKRYQQLTAEVHAKLIAIGYREVDDHGHETLAKTVAIHPGVRDARVHAESIRSDAFHENRNENWKALQVLARAFQEYKQKSVAGLVA